MSCGSNALSHEVILHLFLPLSPWTPRWLPFWQQKSWWLSLTQYSSLAFRFHIGVLILFGKYSSNAIDPWSYIFEIFRSFQRIGDWNPGIKKKKVKNWKKIEKLWQRCNMPSSRPGPIHRLVWLEITQRSVGYGRFRLKEIGVFKAFQRSIRSGFWRSGAF